MIAPEPGPAPAVTAAAPPQAADPRALGRRLVMSIAAGIALAALVLALAFAWLADRLLADFGIPETQSLVARQKLLGWGLISAMVATVFGVFMARRIVRGPGAAAARATSRSDSAEVGLYPYQQAFELAGIGLSQIDREGRLVLVNPRFCKMLGYEPAALIGRPLSEFVHPEDCDLDGFFGANDPDRLSAMMARERRYLRKDGSTLWAQCSGGGNYDADGNLQYALCSIEDVSRYHQAQEMMQSLNESLHQIVQTSPLAIYVINPAGAVSLWNPAAERMFGLPSAEVVGNLSPLMQSDNREAALRLREKILAGKSVRDVELEWTGPGPVRKSIHLAAAPLRNAEERIVGILVTCTDITEMKATARALDEQLHFTRELLEVIPNPIFYRGADGRYLGFNRAWEEFFGIERGDWIGRTPRQKYGIARAMRFESADAEVLESGGTQALEEVIADAQGVDRHIIKQISRFTSPDGTPAGIIGVITDFTGFKLAEEALRASEGRFQALTESAMDIVSVLDTEGRILYQSPSVRHLLGIEPEDMVGTNKFDLVHPEDVERMRASFRQLVEIGLLDKPVEFRVQSRAGEWRTLEAIGKNCLDIPAVGGIILNTRDITDRRAIEARIQHLAFHDALTGLPNRLLIQDRISQAITRAQRAGQKFAVMFIDIDNFKNINDTLGHDAGDELLRGVAERLIESVRAHDTIARQGGDEFIVLVEILEGHRGATLVAQKILEALRAPFKVVGLDQHISASIGLALFPDDGPDAATLMKNADTAMFHGKGLGKNTYQFFTSQMNIAVKRRAAMESNLRAAVKQGDFSVVYQPQIDLNNGEVVGIEALVRWVSEETGTMMPGEFIPLAEETGLISEIGQWVLRESCRQNRIWQDMGLAARRIAVNLSARQLMDKGFVEMVANILAETGLDPRYLELEITESQVMRQGEGSVALLNEIADMGIHIAVDDFGTGYSSLSYLKRLPIRTLKVDQSFIRDITVDPNDTAIVVAIINMAKSLELQVVAEGIETAGQLALLRQQGCSVGQGFYFSVPLPAKDIEPLLAKKSLFELSSQGR